MHNLMTISTLRRAAACGAVGLALGLSACAHDDSSQVFSAAYACENGQRFTVLFEREAATIRLADGRSVRLAQQPAASGIHYANEGYGLRGKGDDATWTVPGQAAVQCKSV